MGIIRTLRSVARFSVPTLSRQKRRFERAANIADLRLIAKSRLPHGIFDYIDGAAEDEITMRRNAEAFQQYEFVPRILRNVSNIDTSTTFLGRTLESPLLFSPHGFHTNRSFTKGNFPLHASLPATACPIAYLHCPHDQLKKLQLLVTGQSGFRCMYGVTAR